MASDYHKQKAKNLQEVLDKLPEKDKEFAASLVDQFFERGHLSDKQWYWVDKLTQKATTKVAVIETTNVGDLTALQDLFATAKSKLKYPAITLQTPSGQDVCIKGPTQNSKVPDALTVTDGKSYSQAQWFGRVLKDGTWQISRQAANNPHVGEILLVLAALAEDPVETAKNYGKLTGKCCFCGKKLEDEKSTAVGYGPVCAHNWKMPYGTGKTLIMQIQETTMEGDNGNDGKPQEPHQKPDP